jgi:NADPH:quinone reductase-like Zn-dependent oxidoreductase/thioesterase domain-containing protein/SAM-dependent methyltransferase/acyl carrier protein
MELGHIRARCRERVKPSDFYRRLREVGLDFGPAFRGIDGLWRRDGEALAHVRSPEAVTRERSRYRLHPALLDACFQALSAALTPGRSDERSKLYLPVCVERIRVRSLASLPTWSHARLVEQGGNSVVGDLEILDESGRALVEITGFRCQAVMRGVGSENPESWIYESRWELAPLAARAAAPIAAAFLPSSRTIVRQAREVLQRRQGATGLRARFLNVESRIDELCAGYFVAALRALGWRPRASQTWTTASLAAELRIAVEHHAVLERHLGFLAADGYLVHCGDRWKLRRALPEVDCGELWRAILARFPALFPELTLIRRCGEALPAILRGELDALSVVTPGGSLAILEELYQDAPSFADYNRAIAAAVACAIHRAPTARTVRILEVGAGTGGLTAHVLSRVSEERTEYVFTDVSPHFFSRAEQKFFDRRFVRCRSLDLEKPPIEQGFAAQSFDIVLASDTLHATVRIDETLAHVRALLAPAGLLLLLEIDRPTRWVDLVFGLTAGWWRFQDRELRGAHALLDQTRWRRALEEAGFIDVEVLADARAPQRSGQSVLVARAPSQSPERAAAVEIAAADRAGHWLLLADRSGVALRLATLLEAQADRVTLVFAGPGDPHAVARGPEISPGSVADFRRFLADLSDPPTGIVHLWSLDSAPAAMTTAKTLEESEALGCHAALHLVQALSESASVALPRLWLVTRGAQPAGDDGRVLAPAQASLWGLGRVIQNEHRRLQCRLVDLDPHAGDEASVLRDELRSEDAEQEVAWRGHARYASRVSSASLERKKRPVGEPAAYRVEIPSPGSLERLALRSLRRRRPGRGEVEIETAAAAINFRDVMKAIAIYPILNDEDLLLGDECAGRIVAVGPGVRGWREGDDVLAMGAGCFASHLTVNARRVARRPRGLTAEEAVTIPVAFLTAWYALHHLGAVRAGERVLIHAATGGVGLAALQVARLAKAEIFATAGSPEKRDLLRALGVGHVMDSRALSFADEVLEATQGRGVDLVLNSLAGEAIGKGLSALAPHGRFLEIGKRDIYQNTRVGLRPFKNGLSMFVIDLPQIMRDQDDLVRTLMARILGRMAARALSPLPHRIMPISEVANAFRLVAKAQHVGKVVLTMDDPSARSRIQASSTAPRFARDATYLVTGGLGGFGLAVAEWMAENGARHFVLVGRSGAATAASRAALRSLRRRGVRVIVAKLDVADEQAVARLMRRVARSQPRLRGVVHAAMVLDDGLLSELDAERFRKVMRPKVQGAWNLHVYTLGAPLDFFVLFSSVSSVVGAPAQGNYAAANSFLDALAHYRQALGLPAVAINWGQLNEVGYVARHEHVEKHLSRQGILGIAPRRALEILGRLLRARTGQVGVVRVDWQRWASFLPGVASAPRFAAVVEAAESETASAGRSAREVVLDALPQDRPSLLVHHVRDQVGRVLRTAAAKLDTRRPLAELGIDSLMAFELMNRLEAQFGVTLQSGKLSGEVTIETLAASLLDLLAAAPAPTAAAAQVPVKGVAAAVDGRVLTLRDGGTTQLFCIHPAGGLANIYKNLAERLTSGVAVQALQSRALYDGLEEHSSIAELANDYAATILACSSSGSHRLLGFSLGGLLALAVARALEERGERVTFVGVIDSDLRLTNPAHRTDAYVRNHIVDMYGTLARELSAVRTLEHGELASEAASLSQRVLAAPVGDRARAIVEWLRERGHLAPELSPAMIDRYFALFEAHVGLVEGFVPPRIAAPLFVWECANGEQRDGGAWNACTSAFVERAELTGNHYELMFPPLVEVVAAGIDAALRRVDTTGGNPPLPEVESNAR